MIHFKLAQATDMETVLGLMAAFYAIDQYPFDSEKSARNFQTFVANPNLGRLWLVMNEDQVIGYACLAFGFSFEYGGRNAFIDELYLGARFRNKGIGKKVLAFIEQEARRLGVQTLHLEVEPHNEGGKKLYSGRGFRDTGRHLFAKRL